ncbi:hypothetical protein CC80DRAFT_510556 [Byssothecium circinans]|uniref:Uncharacterized protein n=1 Tax=Byssothecium circinans TaxID=147558 RepID=A0A6A5TB07_9PLEO|nr:hypothetical protein CC80DRAFT_510556 [Byssothecium circinans]
MVELTPHEWKLVSGLVDDFKKIVEHQIKELPTRLVNEINLNDSNPGVILDVMAHPKHTKHPVTLEGKRVDPSQDGFSGLNLKQGAPDHNIYINEMLRAYERDIDCITASTDGAFEGFRAGFVTNIPPEVLKEKKIYNYKFFWVMAHRFNPPSSNDAKEYAEGVKPPSKA